MNKRQKKLWCRLACVLSVILAACLVGYFAFCFWVNASGSLVKDLHAEIAEQGSAIVVEDFGRRDGVFTLFVAATDEDETRTDSMMVMVFDTTNHTANVINIPRDTLIDTEMHGAAKKLNASYSKGIDVLMEEVGDVIGFCPDKYIVANFDGIADIVDVIGGIDYEIPFDMSYHDPSQDLEIEFEAGWQHLDGEEVVEFLRWRHNDDGTGYDNGDIGRVEKLQAFLVALAGEVLSPANIVNIPELTSVVYNNVSTDLTTSQILWLAMEGVQVDLETGVKMETLIGDTALVDVGTSLWFYILDEDMVIDQINAYFNPYIRDLDEDDFHIIDPDYLGVYSRSWEEEKEYRYAQYEEAARADEADDDSTADDE